MCEVCKIPITTLANCVCVSACACVCFFMGEFCCNFVCHNAFCDFIQSPEVINEILKIMKTNTAVEGLVLANVGIRA